MRILVVDDEAKMASLLRRGLIRHGHVVEIARTGEDAVTQASRRTFDAIVLDVMLPGIDGLETCRILRERAIWAPVLMLTARDGVFDRVAGLDVGADDYLVKPFAFVELLARLRALHRRRVDERPPLLEAGGLRLDPAAHRVTRGDNEITLSAKEFVLLEALMHGAGRVFARDELFEYAWDIAAENRSNVVDASIHRLRQKIDEPFGTESIDTVRGLGYRFRKDGGR